MSITAPKSLMRNECLTSIIMSVVCRMPAVREVSTAEVVAGRSSLCWLYMIYACQVKKTAGPRNNPNKSRRDVDRHQMMLRHGIKAHISIKTAKPAPTLTHVSCPKDDKDAALQVWTRRASSYILSGPCVSGRPKAGSRYFSGPRKVARHTCRQLSW